MIYMRFYDTVKFVNYRFGQKLKFFLDVKICHKDHHQLMYLSPRNKTALCISPNKWQE